VAPITPPVRADTGYRRAFGTAIALAALVVLVSFGLSFHGLYEFARVIVHLPEEFCLTVPFAVDLFALVAMVVAFLTHDAGWKVRAYCWGIVGGTVAVSVAANGIYAWDLLERSGSTRYAVAAVAFAALWPLLSALSLHLIIVARRHLVRRRAAAEAAAQAAREVEEESIRTRAELMALRGETTTTIAETLGQKERTVQRWTEGIRAAMKAIEESRRVTDALEATLDAAGAPPAKPTRSRRTATPKG
jgi:hypothetical protein